MMGKMGKIGKITVVGALPRDPDLIANQWSRGSAR